MSDHHEHDHTYLHAHGLAHSHSHVHENQKAVINRLARALGHLEKVKRMVEEGYDCAEVLVQLPPKTAMGTNAFLYQKEDEKYKRLQAVAVDNGGRAHLYIASVDKTKDYVIGLDVPGESTKDVIIPDELASALSRLEKLEYVHMGRVSSWGVGMGSLTWILVGVLGGTTVLVGGIMFAWNKWKKNAQKKPEKSKS